MRLRANAAKLRRPLLLGCLMCSWTRFSLRRALRGGAANLAKEPLEMKVRCGAVVLVVGAVVVVWRGALCWVVGENAMEEVGMRGEPR